MDEHEEYLGTDRGLSIYRLIAMGKPVKYVSKDKLAERVYEDVMSLVDEQAGDFVDEPRPELPAGDLSAYGPAMSRAWRTCPHQRRIPKYTGELYCLDCERTVGRLWM